MASKRQCGPSTARYPRCLGHWGVFPSPQRGPRHHHRRPARSATSGVDHRRLGAADHRLPFHDQKAASTPVASIEVPATACRLCKVPFWAVPITLHRAHCRRSPRPRWTPSSATYSSLPAPSLANFPPGTIGHQHVIDGVPREHQDLAVSARRVAFRRRPALGVAPVADSVKLHLR